MVVLLAESCVSVAGPVAFLGLLVSHMARTWIGNDLRLMHTYRYAIWRSVDTTGKPTGVRGCLGRAVAFPAKLTVDAMLALIGAPCFIWLIRGVREETRLDAGYLVDVVSPHPVAVTALRQ